MASPNSPRSADERLLQILHDYDVEGQTQAEIARRLDMTRGGIAGQLQRIAAAELPCECIKPENRKGGMPVRWWAQ